MAIYNPYDQTTEVVSFPGITQNPAFHVGGVAANPHTNLISIVADAGAAFVTGGQDISGTNMLITWDPSTQKEVSRLNLTETTRGAYGGFQDVEFDSRGNTYVVGTFPSSILRVEKNGTAVNEWFKSGGNHTVTGFQGLAMKGDVLLANDNTAAPNGSLVRFDTTADKGTPVAVPISPPRSISGSDGLYFPPKYNGMCISSTRSYPAFGISLPVLPALCLPNNSFPAHSLTNLQAQSSSSQYLHQASRSSGVKTGSGTRPKDSAKYSTTTALPMAQM
jgi:hypothetical protein